MYLTSFFAELYKYIRLYFLPNYNPSFIFIFLFFYFYKSILLPIKIIQF